MNLPCWEEERSNFQMEMTTQGQSQQLGFGLNQIDRNKLMSGRNVVDCDHRNGGPSRIHGTVAYQETIFLNVGGDSWMFVKYIVSFDGRMGWCVWFR